MVACVTATQCYARAYWLWFEAVRWKHSVTVGGKPQIGSQGVWSSVDAWCESAQRKRGSGPQ